MIATSTNWYRYP